MPVAAALSSLLTRERRGWSLAICRMGFGLAAMIRGAKTVRDLYLLQHDPLAVPARVFEWAPRMSSTWEIALFGSVWMAAAAGLFVGYRARLSAGVLVALAIFQHVVDQNFWAHHMYFFILTTGLLMLSDSDSTLSVRWVSENYPDRWVHDWPVWLIKVQLSIAYFYSAVAKLNEPFLSGAVLLDRLSLPDFARAPYVIVPMAVGAVAAEFFLCFALWQRRLRPLALVAGVLLHGLIPVFMGVYAGLVVFSLMVFSIYALFLEADMREGLTP